ncbi:hypothetical protein DPSP01_014656 [Paraphaeosphaeria sporulosa]
MRSMGSRKSDMSIYKKDNSSINLQRIGIKKEPTEDKATNDAVSSRPILSQRASTVEQNNAAAIQTRFWTEENGYHEHSIRSVRREGKWVNILRNLVPHLISRLLERLRKEKAKLVEGKSSDNPTRTLAQKYGVCGHVVGWGAFGTVRVAHKTDTKDPKHEQLFAVKELKKHPGESVKRYYKRLTAEFCIASSLHHPNVIVTLDLLQDAKGVYCQVMEYCSGGDLHSLVLAAGQLQEAEADCFFKQLMRGVEYMHEIGVAHRDLKPENILLTQRGTIKITDFGNAECFRTAWEMEAHMSAGICGSAPYIAPEEYVDEEFDPRAVDVWACGIIYMVMQTGQHPWRDARIGKDESFRRYVEGRKQEAGYKPIELLKKRARRNVIYSTLDPNPIRRLTAQQILSSKWFKEVEVCHAGKEGL